MSTTQNTLSVPHIPFAAMAGYLADFGEDVTIMIQGAPGIGKSALLNVLKQDPRFAGYHTAYVDCANLSLGDLAMPCVDPTVMVTNYAPNSIFHVDPDVPTLVLLDELAKSSNEVLNMLAPVVNEKRLGDRRFHPKSIVFCSSNMFEDALGDKLQAHISSRMTIVVMDPPTPTDWCAWAQANGRHPLIISAVTTYPVLLEVYYNRPEDAAPNAYIFDPSHANLTQFSCPRTLDKCDTFVRRYMDGTKTMPEAHFRAFLAGTIGNPAASLLITLSELDALLPTKAEVIADPGRAMDKLRGAGGEGLAAATLLSSNLAASIQSLHELEQVAAFILKMEHMEVRYHYQHMVIKTQRYAQWRTDPKALNHQKLNMELSELLAV